MEEMKQCIPVGLLDQDFLRAAEESAEEIYRHYLAAIRKRGPGIPVTLCTESLEMWRSLGAELMAEFEFKTHREHIESAGRAQGEYRRKNL